MSEDAGGPNTIDSSLIFGFLITFLGLFSLAVIGGIVWPRMRTRLAIRYGIFQMSEMTPQVVPDQRCPEIWDVCLGEVETRAFEGGSAWGHLRPLALRHVHAENPDSAGRPKQAKWKISPPFQALRKGDPDEEDTTVPSGGQRASVAVVITMPSCPLKDEQRLKEFELGVAQLRWCGQDPQDIPRPNDGPMLHR